MWSHAGEGGSGSSPVVDGVGELLLAARGAFGGPDENVTQRRCILLKIASRSMTKPGVGSTELMRGDRTEAAARCRLADNGPDVLGGEAGTPNLAGLPIRRNTNPTLQARRARPGIHGGLDPAQHPRVPQ